MTWKDFKFKEIFKTKAQAEKALKKERKHAKAHGGTSSDLRIKKITGKNFPWEKNRTGYTIQYKVKSSRRKKK